MNVVKKFYVIPETVFLSLESVHTLMNSPGGTGSGDPEHPGSGEFNNPAPGRKVF